MVAAAWSFYDELSFPEAIYLVAKAIDPTLKALDAHFGNPVQGDAAHKVIACEMLARLAEQGIVLVRGTGER